MEPGSFTSEPQYQRPDQRNSDIDFIRRPEPIAAPKLSQLLLQCQSLQLLPLLIMVGIHYLLEDFLIKWEENISLVID